MKKLFLFSFIVIILAIISYGVNEIIARETELIKLDIQAEDPDGDSLTFSYSKPFNELGEWQTNYGDAGEYDITVIVSDGRAAVEEEVKIIILKTQIEPEIINFSPKDDSLTITEGDILNFKIEAVDLNKDELSYIWKIDNVEVSKGDSFTYNPRYNDQGSHQIDVEVNDGEALIKQSWSIYVIDFDRAKLIESFSDLTFKEGDTVSLNLPNFKNYDLEYKISDPIGNDNEWKTNNQDAGDYRIEIEIKDGNFMASKKINLIIENVDQKMNFFRIAPVKLNEGQEVLIELIAKDEDKDDIIKFSSPNLPKGAKLINNKFSWTPNFNTLNKEKPIDYFFDKFNSYQKTFLVKFIAENQYEKTAQVARIVVREGNRPPFIDFIDKININEGESFFIEPTFGDQDFDKVNIRFEGYSNSQNIETDYNSAGDYIIKVIANDGKTETTREVELTINNRNRNPILDELKRYSTNENQELSISLSADDPDTDTLVYGSDKAPFGVEFKNNNLIWKPNFNTIIEGPYDFTFPIYVDDGESRDYKNLTIEVINTNRPPEITSKSPHGRIITYVGEPLIMEVQAFDPDNDTLYYNFNFGLFKNVPGNNAHERVFSKAGKKRVKVEISDGLDQIETYFEIEVLKNPLISEKTIERAEEIKFSEDTIKMEDVMKVDEKIHVQEKENQMIVEKEEEPKQIIIIDENDEHQQVIVVREAPQHTQISEIPQDIIYVQEIKSDPQQVFIVKEESKQIIPSLKKPERYFKIIVQHNEPKLQQKKFITFNVIEPQPRFRKIRVIEQEIPPVDSTDLKTYTVTH